MLAYYAAKAQAWRENPAMDMEREMNRAELERTVHNMPEGLLDELIERYDPRTAAPRFVW